jgi:hypothetical protein
VLHFVSDEDDPDGILGEIRQALVSGSYLSMTHGTSLPERIEAQNSVRELYNRTPTSTHPRSRERIERFLTGWELVEPGLVPVTDWRPDPDETDDPPQRAVLAAIARLP